jgi:PrtD family type I secretion system ABC transporter
VGRLGAKIQNSFVLKEPLSSVILLVDWQFFKEVAYMGGNPAGEILTATMRGCRRTFGFVGLFSLCINLLLLTVPLYMLQVFDRVLTSQSQETLVFLTIIAVGAVLALGLLELIRSRILVRASRWLEERLAPVAFERSMAAAFHGRPYRTEALRDLGQLRSVLGGSAIFSLFDAPWVPIYLLVIFLLHPTLGFVALAGAIVLFALAALNELLTRNPLRTANRDAMHGMQRAEATMRNAEAIDAMGMMPGVVASWLSMNDRALEQQVLASDRAGTVLALSKFLRLAVQIAVLGAGAFLVVRHELTPGAMIAGSILTSRALAPVEQAIGTWKQVIGARAAYGRLKAHFAERKFLRATGMPLPAPSGHLRVEGVTFAYPGTTRTALKAVSCELLPGEALAVVGPSAAGKSTLARLLIGVWPPNAGAVRLDGADVHTWDREDFGRYVGYLPQDVELFAGTVRENIARLGDARPAAIHQAAQMAGVYEMILQLPRGYDTEIGEGGAILSGGQRQRIALARALLGPPRFLVLDEPNSNLDGSGEEALSNAIAAVKAAGGTVVIIAHRPSMLAHVDKILLLRNGQVEAFGMREEVMKLISRPRTMPAPAAGEALEVRPMSQGA